MVLTFSLPFCLLLPDDSYRVKLDVDDIVILKLTKTIPQHYDERLPYRGLSENELKELSKIKIYFPTQNKTKEIDKEDLKDIRDYGKIIHYTKKNGERIIPQLNELQTDFDYDEYLRTTDNYDAAYAEERLKNSKIYAPKEIIINGEIIKDRLGRFRYTKIEFFSNKELHYEKEFERAIKATNILIDHYRVETMHYWITNVRENDILIYQDINNISTSYTKKGFTRIKDDADVDTVNSIKNKLVKGSKPFPLEILLVEAMAALEDEKYYLSIIYSITFLESITKIYFNEYFRVYNISETKRKEIFRRKHLYQLVTEKLKSYIKGKIDKNLIDELGEEIDLRNEIMHDTNLSIDRISAKKTIENVKKIVPILLNELELLNLEFTKNGDLQDTVNQFFSNID